MVVFYEFPNRIWKLYGNIFSNNIEVKHRIVEAVKSCHLILESRKKFQILMCLFCDKFGISVI